MTPDPCHALLASADAALRARLAKALGEAWEIEEARDAARALACARTRPPRLVVACGDDVWRRLLADLRTDLRTAHLPVVVLTDAAPSTQAEALRLGADAALPRAVAPELLGAWAERIVWTRHELRERWSRRAELSLRWEAGDSEDVVFLDRVREVAEAGMVHPGFTSSDLAHALHTSPRQLARRLKALAGETPGALVRRLRMGRAAALLAEGWPVGEVATAVGFRSPSQFRRAYREAHGELPSSGGVATAPGAHAEANRRPWSNPS